MRIAFYEVRPDEHDTIASHLQGHELVFHPTVLSEQNICDADIISCFIYSKVTKDMLDMMPRLRAVITRSTGYDHIDLHACKDRNITVCNVPYYGENTVAEHTFALILSLSRNIHKSYVRTTQGNFSLDGLRGFDLKGKTMGVIGAGHIGLHVIRMAKGFGMHVLAHDPFQNKFLAEVLQFTYADLDEVLKRSDVITLHLPYMQENHHLINKEKFAIMKHNVLFINTSRGGLVDTDALVEALQSGKIRGAGLDVLEGEELIKEERQLLFSPQLAKLKNVVEEHVLLKMDNVVFTPHNAFNSDESVQRILHTSLQNISGIVSGKHINAVPFP